MLTGLPPVAVALITLLTKRSAIAGGRS